jgi:hypothetical protein
VPRCERRGLLAAQQATQNVADRATLAAAENAAEDAAERVVGRTAAAGRTAEDAASTSPMPPPGEA